MLICLEEQQSIWTLIEECTRNGGRQPFDNDCYAPALRDDDRSVLNVSPRELRLWSYYVDDPLATGPPYDVGEQKNILTITTLQLFSLL